jgi:hypothetical protein
MLIGVMVKIRKTKKNEPTSMNWTIMGIETIRDNYGIWGVIVAY